LFLVVLRPARCTLPIWQLGRYCCRLTAGVFRRGSLLVQTGDDGMLVLWCVACMWCRQLDTEDREKALFITFPLSLFSLPLFFDHFPSHFLLSLNRAFHFCMNDYIVLVFFSYLCHGVFLSLLSMMFGTFKSLAAKSYAGIYVCQNFCVIPFFFLAFSLYFRCVFFFLVLSVIFSCELFGFAFGLFDCFLKNTTPILSPSYVPFRGLSFFDQSSRWGVLFFASSQGRLYLHSVCCILRARGVCERVCRPVSV
jgi:hypothetical protein